MLTAFIKEKGPILSLIFVLSGMSSLYSDDSVWPDAADPLAGMGVCFRYAKVKPGELEMLSQAGFRWGRSDFSWDHTEQKPGVYDFSNYDRAMTNADKFHIRLVMILDYGNKLYDQGMSPHTDAGRAAFARWAVAAVTHFQDRGIVWEIWNEPNMHFWKPNPNAEDYAKLALVTSQAIHQAAPGEMIVGPAISGDDIDFIEASARAGSLNYWSAISIHPYFRRGPETYGELYDKVKALIRQYAPPGKKIDIICSETGYSNSWPGLYDQTRAGYLAPLTYVNDLSNIPTAISEDIQGKYLARVFLFDVLSGVTLTLWYDFHNDGVNPSNQEHNFGIVRYDYHAGAAEVYDRKPAYDAANLLNAIDRLSFQEATVDEISE